MTKQPKGEHTIMPKKLSGNKENMREDREDWAAIRREIVDAVTLLVIAMSRKGLPDGTSLGKEARIIASEMAKANLSPQEILEIFQEAIMKSQVKVDGLNLVKVLLIVFGSAITPTTAVEKRPVHRGRRTLPAAI